MATQSECSITKNAAGAIIDITCNSEHALLNVSAMLPEQNPFSSDAAIWNGIANAMLMTSLGIWVALWSCARILWYYLMPAAIWSGLAMTMTMGVKLAVMLMPEERIDPVKARAAEQIEKTKHDARLLEEGRSSRVKQKYDTMDITCHPTGWTKAFMCVPLLLLWATLLLANLGLLGAFMEHMSFSMQGLVTVSILGCLLASINLVAVFTTMLRGRFKAAREVVGEAS